MESFYFSFKSESRRVTQSIVCFKSITMTHHDIYKMENESKCLCWPSAVLFRVEWFSIYKKYSLSKSGSILSHSEPNMLLLGMEPLYSSILSILQANITLICTEDRRGPSLVLGSPGQFHPKTKDLTLLQTVTNINKTEASTAHE
jgi:hypothetical protein